MNVIRSMRVGSDTSAREWVIRRKERKVCLRIRGICSVFNIGFRTRIHKNISGHRSLSWS